VRQYVAAAALGGWVVMKVTGRIEFLFVASELRWRSLGIFNKLDVAGLNEMRM
jgi:hypothetical protein